MLIRKVSDIQRDVDRWASVNARRLSRSVMTSGYLMTQALTERMQNMRPQLVAENEAVRRNAEEAGRAAKANIKWSKNVERITKTLQSNNFCPQSYSMLLSLLKDIDPRMAVTYQMVLSKEPDAPISHQAWETAVKCALAFRTRYTPKEAATYLPLGSNEWKDFYALVVSYLLDTPTVEVTKVVKEKQKVKTVILPVDQKLKARVAELEAALDSYSATSRKQAQQLAAAYNKTIRTQQQEIQRLRALLPESVAKELDAEKTPSEEELLPLPTFGVTFVGSYGTIGGRLQERYPDWDYIDSDVYPEKYPDNPLCFFNTRWISHKQYLHIKRWCPSNLICCNLVNSDRLEREMREAYTLYMRGLETEE